MGEELVLIYNLRHFVFVDIAVVLFLRICFFEFLNNAKIYKFALKYTDRIYLAYRTNDYMSKPTNQDKPLSLLKIWTKNNNVLDP